MSDNSNLLRVATMLPMDPRHRQLLTDSAAEIEALTAERDALREALTPSAETKAAYMGEVDCDCPTQSWKHHVPWTSIKVIMKMIASRAALKGQTDA